MSRVLDSEGLDFEQRDTPVLRAAVEVLEKATEAARSALDKLKLDPMQVNAIATRNEAIKDALAKHVSEPRFTMPLPLGGTLRLGLALERDQVEKLVKGQLALEIEPNDNQARLDHIKRVDQIASGQTSLV